MADDTNDGAEQSSRRKFISLGGAAAVAGLAGCSGGSGGGSGDGGDGGGSGDGSDGGSSGDGGSGESGDPMLAESGAFDPESPGWEENNYLSTPLVDAGYERGTQADLERMGNREVEEVPHGEPVRETPDDESEWLEPDTLVFTESPSEDVQGRYEEDFQAVFDRIEEETGIPVEYNRVNNYAASVEAMRSERAHIANFSTGTTAFAVNLAGAVPFTAGIAPDGAFGYRLFATTRADADGIQSVEDFADDDVRMAHAEP
ncbi:PhnD/SsuA/transferrin family substrate-binding protein, partial [Halorubrum sp. SD626R]